MWCRYSVTSLVVSFLFVAPQTLASFLFTASKLFLSLRHQYSRCLAADCSIQPIPSRCVVCMSEHMRLRCIILWVCVCIHLLATTIYSTLYCKHSIILISFRLLLFFHSLCSLPSRIHVCCMYTHFLHGCVSFAFLFFNLFFHFLLLLDFVFRLKIFCLFAHWRCHNSRSHTVMAERSNVCLIHHKKTWRDTTRALFV